MRLPYIEKVSCLLAVMNILYQINIPARGRKMLRKQSLGRTFLSNCLFLSWELPDHMAPFFTPSYDALKLLPFSAPRYENFLSAQDCLLCQNILGDCLLY